MSVRVLSFISGILLYLSNERDVWLAGRSYLYRLYLQESRHSHAGGDLEFLVFPGTELSHC